MKLLVAFDGSAASKRALDEAVRLAGRLDAGLTLAYVVPPMMPVLNDYSVATYVDLHDEIRRNGEQFLTAEADRLRALGLEVSTELKEGLPAQRLFELSEATDVGYVVVGRSGHGAISRALLGGVVSKLLHLCTKPVVVVH